MLKLVNVSFIEAVEYEINRRQKQSPEYNVHISNKIAKWVRKMDI